MISLKRRHSIESDWPMPLAHGILEAPHLGEFSNPPHLWVTADSIAIESTSDQIADQFLVYGCETTNGATSKSIYIYIYIYIYTGWWFGCHQFYFPIYWECHHPNWRTHIFQRGGPTTNQSSIYIYGYFPWQKPSIFLGIPIFRAGNPCIHILFLTKPNYLSLGDWRFFPQRNDQLLGLPPLIWAIVVGTFMIETPLVLSSFCRGKSQSHQGLSRVFFLWT